MLTSPGSVQEARVTFLAEDTAGSFLATKRNILGQHGLSALIEVESSEGKRYKVLFDTGQYAEAIIHNARLLGVSLEDVDAIVLSHNHYDHTGGLIGVLEKIGRRVPVVVHPDVFKPSIYVGGGQGLMDLGPGWSRGEAERAGAIFVEARRPLEVVPGVYYLGEVEREREDLAPGLPGAYTIVDGELVPHSLRDDTGVAIRIEGYGLVVVSGCGHSGITNIAVHASRALKDDVKAVMGGFHLYAAERGTIDEIAGMLRKIGVEEVYPGHCTGLRAESRLAEVYGDRFHRITAGYTAVFRSPG